MRDGDLIQFFRGEEFPFQQDITDGGVALVEKDRVGYTRHNSLEAYRRIAGREGVLPWSAD